MKKKYAVLGMDVEDWYHLDYFNQDECDTTQTSLDGLEIYLEILRKYQIKTTFFVVGNIVEKIAPILREILAEGHEIALHSYDHRRPLTITKEEFCKDVQKSIEVINKTLNYSPKGYRAPCFSLNRELLDILENFGLSYDASKIDFGSHQLYGTIDMDGYREMGKNIYRKNNFFEFETSTVEFLGKNIPISGGGYIRIFPWQISNFLLKKYLQDAENYFFYIHPFEFSKNYSIREPENTPLAVKLRFRTGRRSVEEKMHSLIHKLKKSGYEFARFEDLLKNY